VGSLNLIKLLWVWLDYPLFIKGWLSAYCWGTLGSHLVTPDLKMHGVSVLRNLLTTFRIFGIVFTNLSHYCSSRGDGPPGLRGGRRPSYPLFRCRMRLGTRTFGLEFFTRSLPCFTTELHSLFYVLGVKIVPAIIYELLYQIPLPIGWCAMAQFPYYFMYRFLYSSGGGSFNECINGSRSNVWAITIPYANCTKNYLFERLAPITVHCSRTDFYI
jgi:hypothetical protein